MYQGLKKTVIVVACSKAKAKVRSRATGACIRLYTKPQSQMSDKDVLISMGFDPARVECTFLGNDKEYP